MYNDAMPDTKTPAQPLSDSLQKQVTTETHYYLKMAADYYQQAFPQIPVLFDLKGRVVGMYRVKNSQRVIRYNPYVFAKYFDDNFNETIAHEAAHYVTDMLFGIRNIRPHGREWKSVMQVFGVAATRTANYDLTGLPARQHKLFNYHCGCRTFELTSRRHNKILRGTGNYSCRDCGGKLLFVKTLKKTG